MTLVRLEDIEDGIRKHMKRTGCSAQDIIDWLDNHYEGFVRDGVISYMDIMHDELDAIYDEFYALYVSLLEQILTVCPRPKWQLGRETFWSRLSWVKSLYTKLLMGMGFLPCKMPLEDVLSGCKGLYQSIIRPVEGRAEPKKKRQETPEQRKARERVSEEEGRRLAFQDRPRLDAEIEEWAAGIDSEELKQWVSEDLAMWRERVREGGMKEAAKDMLEKEYDYMINEYDPMGLLATTIGGADYPDWRVETHGTTLAMEAACSTPLLRNAENADWDGVEFKREIHNDIYVVQGRLRKMKELYRQVMVEMDLIEPVSEPEAEEVEEAQTPTDRGIEWVRDAFLNELGTSDIDIGIDFFIIEEIEEGRILVKGKGYFERPIWGALNDMVRRELGGRYDSSERGWVIEK